jgi:hypothetical protein
MSVLGGFWPMPRNNLEEVRSPKTQPKSSLRGAKRRGNPDFQRQMVFTETTQISDTLLSS